MPLYSQVTFSHIRYSEAWKKGQIQDAIMKQVMAEIDNIEGKWNSQEVENAILKKLE